MILVTVLATSLLLTGGAFYYKEYMVHYKGLLSAYTLAIFLSSNCVVGSVCGQDPRVLLRHLRLLPGEGPWQQLLEPAPVPPLPPSDPPLLLCRHHPLPPGIRGHLLVSCREGDIIISKALNEGPHDTDIRNHREGPYYY